jgi:hypothetical protein
MIPVTARPAASLALAAAVVTLVVAGCGGASASPVPASVAVIASPTAQPSPTPASSPTPAPSLTPVPGGQSNDPGPVGTRIPTTQTDWGEILDALPDSFPVYPDAGIAEVPDEVASGSFEAPAEVDALVAWYTDAFTQRGYSVDTGDALEDGSRVMDVTADLPECRIQLTFRPAEGSTIMSVLVASACANGTG